MKPRTSAVDYRTIAFISLIDFACTAVYKLLLILLDSFSLLAEGGRASVPACVAGYGPVTASSHGRCTYFSHNFNTNIFVQFYDAIFRI